MIAFHPHRPADLFLHVLVTLHGDDGRHELHEKTHDLVFAKTGSGPDIVNLSRQMGGNHDGVDELVGVGSTNQHHRLILRDPFRV